MTIHGGCRCGSVRYRIDGEPLATRLCWCRDCQYFAAGNGTVNVGCRSDEVTITGNPSDFVSTADSGNIMHRRFCPTCGTHLFSSAEARPHLIFVRAGTLDDPELARPTANIWTSSAPSWACWNSSFDNHAGQPPPIA